ncbi:MAG TPA: class I SAM-dependent methyltransferase [Fimbriiglobus sp.]|jgi:methyltransferase-like protein/protein-L-isoaspartate O-methyltransferase
MPDMLDAVPATNPTAPTSTSYDEVSYDSHPFLQTHPSRLFTVATLFGLRPAPVQKCRVLEMGCAAGGNLIPMADYLPEAEFVGIDLAAKQVADGQAYVSKLGLKNLTLKHASIMDVDESYGKFDYIIAHGVYSWVPADVQDKLLEICGQLLNPNGVAYVSYNTYPGWHMRGMIRDMMLYHSGRFNTPQLRIQQARALLDFLTQSVKQDGGAYSQLLKQELETIRHQADYYLYHEHLEEHNTAIYFHQFAGKAAAKGLKYLGEARIGTMVTANFGPEIEKTLRILATDQVQAEQYMDFLRNRMFRETLLVRNTMNPNWAVQPDNLRVLHVASGARPVSADGKTFLPTVDLKSDENVSYKTASGMSMATTRPLLKAAMQVLNESFPCTVPFDQLRKAAREKIGGAEPTDPKTIAEDTALLAVGLLNCYMSSDMVELHGMPLTFLRKPGDKPTALLWSRMQAMQAVPGKQSIVTNRRHEVIRLNDLDRHLIPLLDGTNDRSAIADKLTAVAEKRELNVQKDGNTLSDPKDIRLAITSILDQALINVANQGLMVA